MLGLAEKNAKRPSLDQTKQIIEEVKNDPRFVDDWDADAKTIKDCERSKGYNIWKRIRDLHDEDFVLIGTGTPYLLINCETDMEYFNSAEPVSLAGKEAIILSFSGREVTAHIVYLKYDD